MIRKLCSECGLGPCTREAGASDFPAECPMPRPPAIWRELPIPGCRVELSSEVKTLTDLIVERNAIKAAIDEMVIKIFKR